MRCGIAGVNGRMGQLLVHAVRDTPATLVGGLSRGAGPDGVAAFATIDRLAAACDVVIDFTHAANVIRHAAALARAGCAWVLGTTGLDDAAETALQAAAAEIGIVQAANFSPGVTLLRTLAERMSRALPAAEYDAEILEMHHRQKVDAPSGTAIELGRAVAAGRAADFASMARTDRSGVRHSGDIGFASQRGGQIVGEHTLSFTSAAEQISFTHRAFDRAVFAEGAVRAALWLHGKPPGRYGMRDVLGL